MSIGVDNAPKTTKSVAASEPVLSSISRRRAGTPNKLRLLRLGLALVALLAGIAGYQTMSWQATAADSAERATAQIVTIQSLSNELARADALATNAYLSAGLEPTHQRAEYELAIEEASRLIAQLARTVPDTPQDLAEDSASQPAAQAMLVHQLARYTGLIEQARANNRQGYQAGVAYVNQASNVLRLETMPLLDDLTDRTAEQAAAAYTKVSWAGWFIAFLLLCFALLLLGQHRLALRTKRRLSVPLVIATIITSIAILLGANFVFTTASQAAQVREDSYTTTLAVSQAFTAATQAKSLESVTLIRRGSAPELGELARLSSQEAAQRLAAIEGDDPLMSELVEQLDEWKRRHLQILDAEAEGSWDEAVALAIGDGEGSANESFDSFSAMASEVIESSAQTTSDILSARAETAAERAWLVLVAGVLAAAFAWQGVSRRLDEYR